MNAKIRRKYAFATVGVFTILFVVLIVHPGTVKCTYIDVSAPRIVVQYRAFGLVVWTGSRPLEWSHLVTGRPTTELILLQESHLIHKGPHCSATAFFQEMNTVYRNAMEQGVENDKLKNAMEMFWKEFVSERGGYIKFGDEQIELFDKHSNKIGELRLQNVP